MSWLLEYIGNHLGPLAALIAFPIIVYIALLNFLPIFKNRFDDKDS